MTVGHRSDTLPGRPFGDDTTAVGVVTMRDGFIMRDTMTHRDRGPWPVGHRGSSIHHG
jgi:hypothetical protein